MAYLKTTLENFAVTITDEDERRAFQERVAQIKFEKEDGREICSGARIRRSISR